MGSRTCSQGPRHVLRPAALPSCPLHAARRRARAARCGRGWDGGPGRAAERGEQRRPPSVKIPLLGLLACRPTQPEGCSGYYHCG